MWKAKLSFVSSYFGYTNNKASSGDDIMTADNCEYWQGEGCICEIMTGAKCIHQSKDFVPQCNATNDMLVEED